MPKKPKLYVDQVLDLEWEKVWATVKSMEGYHRYGDDARLGKLSLMFTHDGDAWLDITPDPDELTTTLRFRTGMIGGGDSERVRKALIILAMAIKADNEERKQDRY